MRGCVPSGVHVNDEAHQLAPSYILQNSHIFVLWIFFSFWFGDVGRAIIIEMKTKRGLSWHESYNDNN